MRTNLSGWAGGAGVRPLWAFGVAPGWFGARFCGVFGFIEFTVWLWWFNDRRLCLRRHCQSAAMTVSFFSLLRCDASKLSLRSRQIYRPIRKLGFHISGQGVL